MVLLNPGESGPAIGLAVAGSAIGLGREFNNMRIAANNIDAARDAIDAARDIVNRELGDYRDEYSDQECGNFPVGPFPLPTLPSAYPSAQSQNLLATG